jgi:iron complex transport system ATP-binding protein
VTATGAPAGLAARDLRVVRDDGAVALHDATLRAPRGALTALVGPNGSGKSTLLRALLGLVPATGEITVDDVPLRDLPAWARARHLAWVPQRTQVAGATPVGRVVAMGAFAATGRLDPAATVVRDALRRAGVEALADAPFARLSGGEQQRALLARALASDAPVLLLDEPVSALDLGAALDALALLRDLADEGRAVVAVLHDPRDARRFAHRAALLDRGRVRAEGAADAVLTAEALREVWGVTTAPSAEVRFDRLGWTP